MTRTTSLSGQFVAKVGDCSNPWAVHVIRNGSLISQGFFALMVASFMSGTSDACPLAPDMWCLLSWWAERWAGWHLNLANFLRTLRHRLVKIRATIVRHGRSIMRQMAELYSSKSNFRCDMSAFRRIGSLCVRHHWQFISPCGVGTSWLACAVRDKAICRPSTSAARGVRGRRRSIDPTRGVYPTTDATPHGLAQSAFRKLTTAALKSIGFS